ncbi:unnamed protein product [Lampetra fluviatilis]
MHVGITGMVVVEVGPSRAKGSGANDTHSSLVIDTVRDVVAYTCGCVSRSSSRSSSLSLSRSPSTLVTQSPAQGDGQTDLLGVPGQSFKPTSTPPPPELPRPIEKQDLECSCQFTWGGDARWSVPRGNMERLYWRGQCLRVYYSGARLQAVGEATRGSSTTFRVELKTKLNAFGSFGALISPDSREPGIEREGSRCCPARIRACGPPERELPYPVARTRAFVCDRRVSLSERESVFCATITHAARPFILAASDNNERQALVRTLKTRRYAVLRYSELRYAVLRYSELRYAVLRYSELLYAVLRYSELLYAVLRYSELR